MAHTAYLQNNYSNGTGFWLISLFVGVFFLFPPFEKADEIVLPQESICSLQRLSGISKGQRFSRCPREVPPQFSLLLNGNGRLI